MAIARRARDEKERGGGVEIGGAPPAEMPAREQRLGRLLVASGLISEDQLARALATQRTTLASLGAVLVNQGALHEDSLTQALSSHLDTPIADLKHGEVDADVARMVPEEFARRHLVLPLSRQDRAIALAMAA